MLALSLPLEQKIQWAKTLLGTKVLWALPPVRSQLVSLQVGARLQLLPQVLNFLPQVLQLLLQVLQLLCLVL